MPAPLAEGARPIAWADYVGQTRLKERLQIQIKASITEHRRLDHLLFTGPPGYGKTTLANLISLELDQYFTRFRMPVQERELLNYIEDWPVGVILLDEIHAAPKAMQLMFYDGLEEGVLQGAKGHQVDCSNITFLGATTDLDGVFKPLRDRFMVPPPFVEYSDDEMRQIIEGMARRHGVAMPTDVAAEIARAAGGTPRTADKIVRSARDLAANDLPLTAAGILDQAGIDADGLSERHVDYLRAVLLFGGCTGLVNIRTRLRLAESSVVELEHLLLDRKLIRLEAQGRALTAAGRAKARGEQLQRSAGQ